MSEPIRVFVSYSGDDWESFVKPFATLLLQNGVNAVVANWDIHAGQSLVRRILDEEIPEAQAIIIVLSKSSVKRPWVLEELDHATVRRIEEKIKVIPVKIENCEVPAALRTVKRVSYRPGDNFDERTQEVIDAIFETSRKPPLGEPPIYVRNPRVVRHDLTQPESHVFEVLLDTSVRNGTLEIDVRSSADDLRSRGLTDDQINRSVSKLKARGYLKEHRSSGSRIHYATQISLAEAIKYSRDNFTGYDTLQLEIAVELASISDNEYLRYPFPEGVPTFIFKTIIEDLRHQRVANPTWTWGPTVLLHPATPLIDEWIEDHG